MNSTPLGRVLDERQLLRHRTRSEFPLEVGSRIDFLKYAAWLSETHQSRIERKNSPVPEMGSISAAKVLKLLNLQQRRCALSGRPLVPETAAIDHVLPISRGGKHNIDNAQVLHKDVNRAKGALTNEEFVALCREVAAWAE